jgi:uncharacterized membrane protein
MVEEIIMRKRNDIIATITSICILPFTVSLVYGMYKLTCLSDWYFIWLMSSCLVMMTFSWGYSKRG